MQSKQKKKSNYLPPTRQDLNSNFEIFLGAFAPLRETWFFRSLLCFRVSNTFGKALVQFLMQPCDHGLEYIRYSAHMAAGEQADRFGIAVFKQKIEVFQRHLLIFFAVDDQQRRAWFVEPALVEQRQRRGASINSPTPRCAPGARLVRRAPGIPQSRGCP